MSKKITEYYQCPVCSTTEFKVERKDGSINTKYFKSNPTYCPHCGWDFDLKQIVNQEKDKDLLNYKTEFIKKS